MRKIKVQIGRKPTKKQIKKFCAIKKRKPMLNIMTWHSGKGKKPLSSAIIHDTQVYYNPEVNYPIPKGTGLVRSKHITNAKQTS